MTIKKDDKVVYLVGSGAEKDIGIPLGNQFLADVFLSYPRNIFINLKQKDVDFKYTERHINHLCEESFLSYNLEDIKDLFNTYFNKPFEEISETDILRTYKTIQDRFFDAESRYLKDVRKLFFIPLYLLLQIEILEHDDNYQLSENKEAVLTRIGNFLSDKATGEMTNLKKLNKAHFKRHYNRPLYIYLLDNKTYRKDILTDNKRLQTLDDYDQLVKLTVFLREYLIISTDFSQYLSDLYIEFDKAFDNPRYKPVNLALIGQVLKHKFAHISLNNLDKNYIYSYLKDTFTHAIGFTTNYTDAFQKISDIKTHYLHGNFWECYNSSDHEIGTCNYDNSIFKINSFPYLILQSSAKSFNIPAIRQRFDLFERTVTNAKYLIIIGYAFSKDDNHINQIIESALKKGTEVIYFNYENSNHIPNRLNKEQFHNIPYQYQGIKDGESLISYINNYID